MSTPISYRQEVFRKLIHLSSLWMAAAIYLLPQYRWRLGAVFAVCWALNLAVERLVVLKTPVLTPLYGFFFRRMLRDEPKENQWVISGGPPVWAAAALVTLIFPALPAATALAVMLLSDTAAALVGRRFGKHKSFNGKSIEGTAAFCAAGIACVAAFALLAGVTDWRYWLCGVAGIFPAAAAELFEKQLHVDDNFSIPLIAGAFLTLGTLLAGGGL